MDADQWAPPDPAAVVRPEEGSARAEPGSAALGSTDAGASGGAGEVPAGGRRRRTQGGRRKQIQVKVTEGEHEQLRERAEAAGVSVQRLMVETVMSSGRVTPGERRGLYATLMACRRTLAGACNNLNQLTRWSHAAEEPHPDIDEAILTVERAARRLTVAVDDVDDAVHEDAG